MNDIIEKIRVEVESKIRDTNNDTSVGAMESLTISKTLRDVLSILSDLEEECEETPNDLEEVSQEYEKKHTHQRYDGGGFTPEYDATLAEAVIFGPKWQAEKDARDMYMSDNRHFEKVYQLGRTDMREQMLKEAVEGRVISNDGISFPVSNEIHRLKLIEGDKVRIIIVKEN